VPAGTENFFVVGEVLLAAVSFAVPRRRTPKEPVAVLVLLPDWSLLLLPELTIDGTDAID